MYIYLIIIVYLISPSISSISQIYAPMSSKTFEFDIEDICSYQNRGSDYIYVEPCETGYRCELITSASSYPILKICHEYSKAEISFGSSCEKDDDCEDNLKCLNKICTVGENDEAVIINSNNYCSDSLIPILDSNTNKYICATRKDHPMDGLCYKYDSDASSTTGALPDYNKVCGKITLDEEANGYTKLAVSADSIGSVADGEFVENSLACKSGFTLRFFADGKIDSTTTTVSYEKCVQFNKFEEKGSYCNIKYTLDKKSYNYDVNKVSSSLITNKNTFCNGFKFIKTKLELFKEYIDKTNELVDECKKKKYYDEPYTCKNDQLRKLFHFYNNVEEYLLYKNEEEVIEFLLQKEYPDYGVKFSKTDSSNLLRFNFISLLLIITLVCL